MQSVRLSFLWIGYGFFGMALFFGMPSCGGSASSSDPVTIPAPVAGLISVSSPNASGEVTVRGAAGAVQNAASVTVSNTTDSASVSTTASATGTFVAQITAGVGDTISITQSVDGQTSSAASSQVQSGVPATEDSPLSVAIDPALDFGFAASTDGTHSFIDYFDLENSTQNSPETLSNFVMADFDYDASENQFYAIDTTQDRVLVLDILADLVGDALSVTNPVMIVVADEEGYALVGQESATSSITMIDNTSSNDPDTDATLLISHPTDGQATHENTFALDMDVEAGRAVALSTFSNGDTIFSFMTITPPPGGSLTVTLQSNLGESTFRDIDLFNDGTEALVVDEGTNEVLPLGNAGFNVLARVDVGDAPTAIAIDEEVGGAFVVNNGDDTISVLDLTESPPVVIATLDSGDGVGRGPVDIALDDDPFVALVANQTSFTVSLIDLLTALANSF